MKTKHQPIAPTPVTPSGDQNAKQRTDHMKTNNYWSAIVSTVLITGVLLGTALPSSALPGPDDYKKLADEVKNATVTPTLTASAQTVQIPAGQNEASTQVSWNIGTGRPIIVLRVRVNGGAETDLQTLPSVPGPGFVSQPKGSFTVSVKPGTNVFSLNQAGQTLATVTVTGRALSSAPAKPNTSNPAATPSAEADDSSSNDSDDQHGKHKKNKKKNKHHHHHDDDQDQSNDND